MGLLHGAGKHQGRKGAREGGGLLDQRILQVPLHGAGLGLWEEAGGSQTGSLESAQYQHRNTYPWIPPS